MATVKGHLITPLVRDSLRQLYAEHRRDAIMVQAVLEKGFGSATYDGVAALSRAGLTLNDWTLVAGEPGDPRLGEFVAGPGLEADDLTAVLPWPCDLYERFDFHSRDLDPSRLRDYASAVPDGYELVSLDEGLAERLVFAVAYESADDFLEHGLGFCLVRDGAVASAALSYMCGLDAVDIQINTFDEAQRRKGLATCAAAALCLHCLERGLEPQWNAANPISRALAEKLGFVHSETYSVIARTTR